MTKEKLYIFDTTLRDGQQTQGVDFSVQDKIIISEALDKSVWIILRVVGQVQIQRIQNFLSHDQN